MLLATTVCVYAHGFSEERAQQLRKPRKAGKGACGRCEEGQNWTETEVERWRELSQPVLSPAGAAEALCPSKLVSLAGSLLGPSPGPRGQEA